MQTSHKSSESKSIQPLEDFSYCDIYLAKNLELTEIHFKALTQLKEGHTASVKLEKLRHKKGIYSIRADSASRIIGTFVSNVGQKNKRAFWVFAIFDKHEYKDLKLMNLDNLNHPEVDLDFDLNETAIIDKTITEVTQEGFDVKTVGHKTHYINQQVICFSDEQREVLHTATLPLIITGPGGSGKTLVIIKTLYNLIKNRLDDGQDRRYLYIAPTENLAKEARRIFEEFFTQPRAHNVTFTTIDAFIEENKPKKHTVTTKKDLNTWLKNGKFGTIYGKLLKNIEYLIEEFKTAATMKKEDYVELGEAQTLYATKEERTLCYDLFSLYKSQNKNSCQFLFPDLKEDKPQYDMVIIDEGQNYTIKQLFVIIECAKNRQFMIFGDPLQGFINKISVFPRLKQTIELKQFNKAFRSPQPIIDFVNDVIFVKRLLSGGVDDACESRQLKSAYTTNSNSRPIDWIETLSETKREALKERLNQTETMIITCDANTIEAAQKEFGPEPLIIMPEHVQGLEGTLVVIYYPFTKKLIREINAHLKQIDTTKDCINLPKNNGLNTSKFTMDLNKLIVAATRVVRNGGELVIYIGKHEAHDSDIFFSLIKKSFSKHRIALNEELNPATPLNTMSNEDWIIKLYKEGQEETAKRRYVKHINPDLAGFNAFVGAPTPQLEPIISQKSTRTKKRNTPNNTNTPSNTQKHNQASVLIHSKI